MMGKRIKEATTSKNEPKNKEKPYEFSEKVADFSLTMALKLRANIFSVEKKKITQLCTVHIISVEGHTKMFYVLNK